ncbi:alpha/beta fold hydrolase [Sphingomonas sp. IC4-52]|uniref:alpha/beta fold hydrolase n=1 Tax=Sphingomonas sp. IC4-52 TaxID=2887202 RepID=UPI001D12224F|nr:alpha/beta hydrolase [Sphingomonas sp. IC4-52]MCC2981106.1 alpha/beta hydrolase [Sphingomonas sp. IC4-52]
MNGLKKLASLLAVGACLAAPVATGQGATPESAYEAVRPMIADMQKIVAPGGVQLLETVELGGVPQWISVRGVDRRNPIVIYVHGGPGAAELGRSWPYQRGLEEYFTVVQWDQRGTGKTLRTNGAETTRPSLSRNRMAQDLVELIAHVRKRFGHDKVALIGHSWGNVIGMDAAMARPDWISAYIGMGPLVNMAANEAQQYAGVLAIARQRNDRAALAELNALAPYPGSGPIPFEKLNVVRKWVMAYGGLAAYRDNANFYFRAARLSPAYDLADRQSIDQGGQLSVGALLPELTRVDHTPIRSTPFPVFMFLGRHDLTTPSTIAVDWLNRLDAPAKQVVWFEHSAHLPPHEEPGKFVVEMATRVRPVVLRSGQR